MNILRTPADKAAAIELLKGLDESKPWQFDLRPYKRDRSAEQNRLAFRWYTEISRHLGDQTAEEIRAHCKAYLGIPILNRDNEAFRETYNRCIRPLSTENKLEIIERMDIQITRLMNVKQMSEYLGAMQMYWSRQGIVLEGTDDDSPTPH